MAKTADERKNNRERTTGPGAENFDKRLTELDKKLDAVHARNPERPDAGQRRSAMGIAFRVTTELLAGVLVGGFIGWQLDYWLGTKPVMLLIFFVLGAAAGILNVMRVARQMQPGVLDAKEEPKQSGTIPKNG